MKTFLNSYCSLAAGLLLATAVGCGSPATETAANDAHDDHAEHAHPSEGPHGGSLIELGQEDYHAELIHDEAAGSVTIYLLDSAAKNAVAIEATELKINLSHDGEAEQFSLAANPETTDEEGKSSRFSSTDSELAEELDHDHSEAQLVVTIAGKQFRGSIEHSHDHEGHAHEEHDAAGHEEHDHDASDDAHDHPHGDGDDHAGHDHG